LGILGLKNLADPFVMRSFQVAIDQLPRIEDGNIK
jgi:hypothetical protein